MLLALSLEGNKVRASKNLEGKCPFCDKKLLPKCGPIVIHHWAHYPGEVDELCQSYEETEWHRQWKQQFNQDWIEQCLVGNTGKKRIADALIPANPDKVIEFQASSISVEEIEERNKFHKPYRDIIWVFNAIEPHESDRLRITPRNQGCSWIWSSPRLSQLLGVSFESHKSEGKRYGESRWNYKVNVAAFFDLGEKLLLIKSWWRRESWQPDSIWANFVAGWGYLWNKTEFLLEMQKLAKPRSQTN